MTLTADQLSSKRTVTAPETSIARLEREIAEAEAAYDAAEETKRRSSPEFLKAQVQLKESKLAELREAEDDARQNLRIELAIAEELYAEAFERRYAAETERCDAAEALNEIDARRQALRRKAHAAGLDVVPLDSFAVRCAGHSGDPLPWGARVLQSRILKLPKPW